MSPEAASTRHVYVVTLAAPERRPTGELRGRIEHVVSGRRHDFDTGPGLLACLAHEELQLRADPPGATGPVHPAP